MMSILTDSLTVIDQLIAKKSEAITNAIAGSTRREKTKPTGKLQQDTVNRTTVPVLDNVESNPIVNMGVDVLNEAVTKVTQQLVVTGAKQLEATINRTLGIPVRKTIQDATDTYFTAVALATTAQVEVVMEFARVTARQIVRKTEEKDRLIDEIQQTLKELSNAINIILNSQPFIDDYIRQLQQAYTLIDLSNKDLKQVVRILRRVKRYQKNTYDRAVVRLEQARDLILPDRGASISEITSADFFTDIVGRKSNRDAVAAAMSIPGISFKLGRQLLSYIKITSSINGLLAIYKDLLEKFISNFQRNDNLDQATINHITSATNQLDALLEDMKAILFPTDGRENSALYPAQVSTNATGWGIRLTTTIEWLKIQPGKASDQLDLTSDSVRRYQQSIVALKQLNNREFGFATLTVREAAEDTIETAKGVGNLLLLANTVVARREAPADIRIRFFRMRDTFRMAKDLDANIRTALFQFINTENNLIAGARQTVNNLTKVARNLGLDKVADSLANGDINGVLAMTSKTSTYAGAAVVAIGTVIGFMQANNETTDSEVNKLQAVRDSYERDAQARQVEAQRGAENSAEVFVAEQQQALDRDRRDSNAAGEVLKSKDRAGTTGPLEIAQSAIGKALGSASLGGILRDNPSEGSGGIFGGGVSDGG